MDVKNKGESLKSCMEDLFSGYRYSDIKKTKCNDEQPMSIIIKDKFPAIIKKILNITENRDYTVKGSPGQSGTWATIPSIGIFMKKITNTPSKGVFVVYLLSEDNQRLYLTLNQGCKELNPNYTQKEAEPTTRKLRENASLIQEKYPSNIFIKDNSNVTLLINDKNILDEKKTQTIIKYKHFEDGVIYYKEYDNGHLPSEDILEKDLLNMFDTYRKYCEGLYSPKSSSAESMANNHPLQTPTEDNNSKSIPKNYPHNIILFGPPGTGKTFYTTIYAEAIANKHLPPCEKTPCGKPSSEIIKPNDYSCIKDSYDNLKIKEYDKLITGEDKGRIGFITFHQSYSYEDFIEGIRPEIDGQNMVYRLKGGIFREIALKAKSDSENNYVLIIDEINRGNISKIFGELITLIEDSKRLGKDESTEAILPYSGKPFGVPKNLYIIGTMNTADRSLIKLDAALRRRFKFIDMTPNYDLLKHIEISDEKGEVTGIKIATLLEVMNKRIAFLLDSDHIIGHAYFMETDDNKMMNIKTLGDIFKNKIIPLLQEYFYDDYRKIRIILGEDENSGKENREDSYFIKTEKRSSAKVVDSTPDSNKKEFQVFTGTIDDATECIYSINDKAFMEIDAYLKIYTRITNAAKEPSNEDIKE